MFEEPFIKRKFRGKMITFDVTRSGAILGPHHPALESLSAIKSYLEQNGIKTILDFGAGKNLRNTKPFANDPRFEAYFSEYEQLISHNLSIDDIKEPTRFVTAIAKPKTPLSEYLHSKLSKDTLADLNKYDGSKSPTKKLQQTVVDELNSLLQTGSLYEGKRFAMISLTQRTQKLIAQKPESRKKLLRLNRLLLQEAYSGEIGEYPTNLERLLYPEELELEPLAYDAILLSYVLHILPDEKCRMDVLKACCDKAGRNAVLVVASPNYNTNARNACASSDKYDIGWVKYNTPDQKYKAFYSEPTQEQLIKLVEGAGFVYDGNWHQSTAKVLRFRKA